MKTLYLHVGPHKTGTTSIQKFMLDNQAILFKSNLVYPKQFVKIFGHHDFRQVIAERRIDDQVKTFFNDNDHDFVLSSEDLISLNKEDFEYLRASLAPCKIVVIYT